MSTAAPIHRSHRHAAVLIGGSAALSIVTVAILVMVATSAAWTTQTDVETPWGTAQLGLDQTEVVEFNADNMLPGDVESGSVTVENTSSVDLDVRLYGDNLEADTPEGETESLAQHLTVSVGTTAGGDDVYAGTLADFPSDFATAFDELDDLDMNANRTYHFEVTLAEETPSAYQASDAALTFVFEGQAG